MSVRVLDQVVLVCDLPSEGLRTGDVGVLVEQHGATGGCEVEFLDATGETEAVVTLALDDIRPLERDDLWAVRPYTRPA